MKTFLVATIVFLPLSGPALAQSAIPSVRKKMMGIWGFEDRESCDNKDSDMRMTVRAKGVEFFAAAYQLKKIWRQADGTVKATAMISEEGEEGRRRGTIELKLVSPNKLSVKTNRDEPMIYLRCKSPGKTR